jgi:hypothetical protein
VGGEVRVAEVVGYALADADEPDDLLAPAAAASASAAAVERARSRRRSPRASGSSEGRSRRGGASREPRGGGEHDGDEGDAEDDSGFRHLRGGGGVLLLLLGDGADADGADDGEGDAGPLARVEAFAEAEVGEDREDGDAARGDGLDERDRGERDGEDHEQAAEDVERHPQRPRGIAGVRAEHPRVEDEAGEALRALLLERLADVDARRRGGDDEHREQHRARGGYEASRERREDPGAPRAEPVAPRRARAEPQ